VASLNHDLPPRGNPKSDSFRSDHALVARIRAETGIPLTKAGFDKLAMQGRTPTPDCYFGKRELYRPKRGVDWARETLISSQKTKLGLR
jgi:hypothetical protein